MKLLRHIFILLAGIFLTALAITLLARPREPAYQGKPLNYWLLHLSAGSSTASNPASQAIQQMGTNALPALLRILKSPAMKPSAGPAQWRRWWQSLPFLRSWRRADVDWHWQAVSAIKILGPTARPAIPTLAHWLERGRNPGYVTTALAAIGPEALATLTNAFRNTNALVRFAAASAVPGLQPNAQPARAALRLLLNDSQSFVREAATNALWKINGGGGATGGKSPQ